MDWLASLNGDPIPWLIEPDPANPGVRYFALRDLLDRAMRLIPSSGRRMQM